MPTALKKSEQASSGGTADVVTMEFIPLKEKDRELEIASPEGKG